MLEFKKIDFSDKDWINEALKKSNYMSCEHSFASYMIWRNMYNVKVCNVDGFYVAMYEDDGQKVFLCPAGDGDLCKVIQKLIDYAKENNFKFVMSGVTQSPRDTMQKGLGDKLIFHENRDFYDYIYLSESLITLKGKKLHSKRNHINRFKELNWSFEPITSENKHEAYQMSVKWCKQNDCGKSETAKKECDAVRLAFEEFEKLGFDGGLLRVDGEVVAYSVGEGLNSDTYVVHLEKAFSDVQGAYPTINQEFAKYAASNYKYINREEDIGVEGLRKAKLSYLPEIILPKYGVTLKDE